MNRGVVLGFVALLAAPTAAMAQASLERGRYLVDTVMTCHNCHTPMGPNGPQFDKALSGGLRFDEPAVRCDRVQHHSRSRHRYRQLE
jgi:hypothetical protein